MLFNRKTIRQCLRHVSLKANCTTFTSREELYLPQEEFLGWICSILFDAFNILNMLKTLNKNPNATLWFKVCDIIISPLPTKMYQPHLFLLIPHWLHKTRFWCQLFADWFIRNDTDNLFFDGRWLRRWVRLRTIHTVADPGFGQGGAKNFPEILLMSWSGVRRANRANIGRGPGPALGPWELLHF